jgi:hypothetical protein
LAQKKLLASVERKRAWVDLADSVLSVSQQCELLGLSRSSYYYEPANETAENLSLMEKIDRELPVAGSGYSVIAGTSSELMSLPLLLVVTPCSGRAAGAGRCPE